MADRYPARKPGARLSRDDHEWLAKVARREHTSAHAVMNHALLFFRYWHEHGRKTLNEALELIGRVDEEYQRQTRRRRYFEREYRMQSRLLHSVRRACEKQLWEERSIRRKYENKLREERTLRRACEKQLLCQQSHQQDTKGPRPSYGGTPYGPTVAKLLALAVCSESDGEAETAFEKARALHRLAIDSAASTWVQRHVPN